MLFSEDVEGAAGAVGLVGVIVEAGVLDIVMAADSFCCCLSLISCRCCSTAVWELKNNSEMNSSSKKNTLTRKKSTSLI